MTVERDTNMPEPFRGEDALPLPTEVRMRRKKPRDPSAAFEPGSFDGWPNRGRGF